MKYFKYFFDIHIWTSVSTSAGLDMILYWPGTYTSSILDIIADYLNRSHIEKIFVGTTFLKAVYLAIEQVFYKRAEFLLFLLFSMWTVN